MTSQLMKYIQVSWILVQQKLVTHYHSNFNIGWQIKIEDTTLTGTIPESMISAALGITMTDSPNDSILGFDPIAYFNGSDSTLAEEARPVFAASQLLMAQGGSNYGVNKYIFSLSCPH